MCFVLYMASSSLRPAIPWDPENRAFHVVHGKPQADRVKRQFSRPFVHYLGSDNGCGCGFPRHECYFDDDEERFSRISNQVALVEYLKNCLKDEDTIELFGCWNGDEELAPVSHRKLVLAEIAAPGFYFVEREHLMVSGGGGTRGP